MVTEEESAGEMARTNCLRWVSVAVGLVTFALKPITSGLLVLSTRQQPKTDREIRAHNEELMRRDEEAMRARNEVQRAHYEELMRAISSADHKAQVRDSQVQRQQFESRLANALDMAEGEREVIDVIERSFSAVLPDAPVELLLVDDSHARLLRMAAVGPDGEPPNCSVDSPERCPAARRAQIQAFPDSDDLDACPKLRNRPQGRLSALCVPVSITGRTMGVIHATGRPREEVNHDAVDDLATLAKLAGARIGLLRVKAESQLEVPADTVVPESQLEVPDDTVVPESQLEVPTDTVVPESQLEVPTDTVVAEQLDVPTDALTGLFSPRSFSEQVAAVPVRLHPVAVAMADLDHFQAFNDRYGHETGDHALRLFAGVLRDSLRNGDIISRYGGDEFAIAFPDCAAKDASRVLETLRTQFEDAIIVGGLPRFTFSIGVTEGEPGEELPAVLRRADDALLLAKLQGGDRVVLHDAGLAMNGAASEEHGANADRDAPLLNRSFAPGDGI